MMHWCFNDTVYLIATKSGAYTFEFICDSFPEFSFDTVFHVSDNPLINPEWYKATLNHFPGMKSQEELNVFRAFISYRLLNNKFPPFQMLSVDGDSINNRSFSNGVTVLNFWYYGCYGCILELPALNQLCNSFSKDSEINFFSFFNDSVIRKKDSLFFSTRIMSSKVNGRSKPQYSDACYNQLSDTKKFSDQIPIFEYPTNMIVDCDGIVRFIIVGGWRDSTAWIEMIKDKIREQTRICNKGKMN